MSVLAVFRPTDLLARELREQLDRRPELWHEVRLLALDDDEVGVLTELAGAATFIRHANEEGVRGVDVLFSCAPWEETEALSRYLDPGATVVLVGESGPGSTAIVAGVNDDEAGRGMVLSSPSPEIIHLALLLAPLRHLGLSAASATVMLPVSRRGQLALDAMLDQTRDILGFRGPTHREELGAQLAFNLTEQPASERDLSGAQALDAVLGGELAIACQRLEAGVFHGCAASVHVQLDPGIDLGDLVEALREASFLELDHELERLGPIDAAARDEVLVADPRRDASRPGAFWLWSAMDNLTRGGASNALAIVERLLVQ